MFAASRENYQFWRKFRSIVSIKVDVLYMCTITGVMLVRREEVRTGDMCYSHTLFLLSPMLYFRDILGAENDRFTHSSYSSVLLKHSEILHIPRITGLSFIVHVELVVKGCFQFGPSNNFKLVPIALTVKC